MKKLIIASLVVLFGLMLGSCTSTKGGCGLTSDANQTTIQEKV